MEAKIMKSFYSITVSKRTQSRHYFCVVLKLNWSLIINLGRDLTILADISDCFPVFKVTYLTTNRILLLVQWCSVQLCRLPWSTQAPPYVEARVACPPSATLRPPCPSHQCSPPVHWWHSWPCEHAFWAGYFAPVPPAPRYAWTGWSTAWLRGSSQTTCKEESWT